MSDGKPHFGEWVKRVRGKLGLTQKQMAKLLGLESPVTIHLHEKRADRSMQSSTAEGLLDLLGYASDAELDSAWRSGAMPDIPAAKARLAEAAKLSRRDEEVRFTPQLTANMFRWLASHPPRQLRDLLRRIPKEDAATVGRALFERVAEDDGGGGGKQRA